MAKKEFALDARNKEVMKGDTVLVRHAFPKTARLSYGVVEKIKVDKLGRGYLKIKGCNKWFVKSSFYKLADK